MNEVVATTFWLLLAWFGALRIGDGIALLVRTARNRGLR